MIQFFNLENRMTLPTSKVYLSRRNLEVLLSKLDRKEKGEKTECTLIKYKNLDGPYVQSMSAIQVTAVSDEDYYMSQHRLAGDVHPLDEPK